MRYFSAYENVRDNCKFDFLGGLAIGTGITVDAGIVVLESISLVRSGNRGMSMVESAIKGTVFVAAPVVASVLTTVVVFLPIVFLEGLAGAVFRDLALSVSFSIFISLFSSLTLVPMFASLDIGSMRFRFPGNERVRSAVSGFAELSDRATSGIIEFYGKTINMALARRGAVISAGVISLFAGLLLFLFIEKEVMPAVDPGEFSIVIEMPGGTPLSRTSEFCRMIEERLGSTDGINFYFTKAGCDPDDNISEKISGRGSDYALIRVFINRSSGRSSREIIDELKGVIKSGDNVSITYNLKEDIVGSFFSSGRSSVNIELYGSSIDELREGGKKIKGFLQFMMPEKYFFRNVRESPRALG